MDHRLKNFRGSSERFPSEVDDAGPYCPAPSCTLRRWPLPPSFLFPERFPPLILFNYPPIIFQLLGRTYFPLVPRHSLSARRPCRPFTISPSAILFSHTRPRYCPQTCSFSFNVYPFSLIPTSHPAPFHRILSRRAPSVPSQWSTIDETLLQQQMGFSAELRFFAPSSLLNAASHGGDPFVSQFVRAIEQSNDRDEPAADGIRELAASI